MIDTVEICKVRKCYCNVTESLLKQINFTLQRLRIIFKKQCLQHINCITMYILTRCLFQRWTHWPDFIPGCSCWSWTLGLCLEGSSKSGRILKLPTKKGSDFTSASRHRVCFHVSVQQPQAISIYEKPGTFIATNAAATLKKSYLSFFLPKSSLILSGANKKSGICSDV